MSQQDRYKIDLKEEEPKSEVGRMLYALAEILEYLNDSLDAIYTYGIG